MRHLPWQRRRALAVTVWSMSATGSTATRVNCGMSAADNAVRDP